MVEFRRWSELLATERVETPTNSHSSTVPVPNPSFNFFETNCERNDFYVKPAIGRNQKKTLKKIQNIPPEPEYDLEINVFHIIIIFDLKSVTENFNFFFRF